MAVFVNLVTVISSYYQLKLVNGDNRDKRDLRMTQRFFGRYISDLRYESVVLAEGNGVSKFFILNYHFLGLVKKLLLFFVLVGPFREDFSLQIYWIYLILGIWVLLGLVLRPFKIPVLNFLRSLSDLTLISYFIILHLCDSLKRDLLNLSDEEVADLPEDELQKIAER